MSHSEIAFSTAAQRSNNVAYEAVTGLFVSFLNVCFL